MSESVVLHCDARWCSPWVLAVWVALTDKGVPFETKTVDIEKGEARQGEFADESLTRKVPAIQCGDWWLAESLAILEWVEEEWPSPSIYPADRRERARDRQILSWLRSDFAELRRSMPFEGVILGLPGTPPDDTVRAQVESLLRVVATRVKTGSGGPTQADHELAFYLRRLIAHGWDLSRHQELVAWSDRIWSRPAVQSFVAKSRVQTPGRG